MASGVPPEIIARIKDETDIVEIVRGYVTLRPAGAGFKGLCPFHDEKTPSFNVNPARQIYKCFGCGSGGDVLSFLMAIESITFLEALETLARGLDIDLARYLVEGDDDGERLSFVRAHETAARIYRAALWDEASGKQARRYLAERGFEPETLTRFDLGYAPQSSSWQTTRFKEEGIGAELAQRAGLLRPKKSGGTFAYFRDRIIFPIKNIAKQVAGFGGRVVERGEPKYLNSPDSAYFSKGKLLYGFAESRLPIAKSRVAVLVEGYLDWLALVQAGFNNAVATCGTAFTPDQARLIRRGAMAVTLLFDGDRAGIQAAVRACHAALGAGLEPSVARLPRGEDPASLLEKSPRSAMAAVLDDAQPYLQFLLALVSERRAGRTGRERALRQALTSIGEVSDPIRREYLLQEASELFEIRLDILREHLTAQGARRSRRGGGDRVPDAKSENSAPEKRAPRERFRTLRAVDTAEVERVLFAHILRDASGLAARTFLAERGALAFSSAAAERLAAELAAWAEATGSTGRDPARYVEEHWYGDDDVAYRSYVTDVLTKEGIPDQTDFERAIRESLERLRLGRSDRAR
jgi:DNA primase